MEPALEQAVGIIFIILALIPLFALAWVYFGCMTCRINARRFSTGICFGHMGVHFRRPTTSAERVSVRSSDNSGDEEAIAGTIVQLGSSKLLAGWGHTRTCRDLAGLIRYQFRQLEIETTDSIDGEA